MSDEAANPPENPEVPHAGGEPNSSRVSNPRAKKKKAKAGKPTPDTAESADPVGETPASTRVESPPVIETPVREDPRNGSDESEGSAAPGDWPEPEPPSMGGVTQSEGGKRKRRRKKGKGGGNAQGGHPPADSPQAPEGVEPAAAPQPGPQPQRPQPHPPRFKADPELLAKHAWKIYLAEVSEEGIALIGDNDAKDLARRCFRLAEIFLEEQSRRR